MTAKNPKLVNARPLNDSEKNLTEQQLHALKQAWRNKLKQSGFEDIEKWTNFQRRNKLPAIIKGHIRWDDFKGREHFSRKFGEVNEFFRVIETFVYYSDKVPDKYKDVLIQYCMTGNLLKSCRLVIPNVNRQSVQSYIHKNFQEMIAYSVRFHSQPDDIELGESDEVH